MFVPFWLSARSNYQSHPSNVTDMNNVLMKATSAWNLVLFLPELRCKPDKTMWGELPGEWLYQNISLVSAIFTFKGCFWPAVPVQGNPQMGCFHNLRSENGLWKGNLTLLTALHDYLVRSKVWKGQLNSSGKAVELGELGEPSGGFWDLGP